MTDADAEGFQYDVALSFAGEDRRTRCWSGPTPTAAPGVAQPHRHAIRYTPTGGRITTEISVREATPDVVYLRVHDTGIGIERQKPEAIFDPFVTLRRAFAEGTDGTELGLTINRRLARGKGGDLRVRSAEGNGSTFTITLRRATTKRRSIQRLRKMDRARRETIRPTSTPRMCERLRARCEQAAA